MRTAGWIGDRFLDWGAVSRWASISFLLGIGIGAVTRYLRPHFPGPVHHDALIALIALILMCLSLLLMHLRCRPRGRTLGSLQLGTGFLWLGYMIGWSIVHRSFWDDLVIVTCVGWMISGSVAGLMFIIIHRRWGPPADPCCRHCGYLLIGLTEHRCPECGRAFTLSELGLTETDLDAKHHESSAEPNES